MTLKRRLIYSHFIFTNVALVHHTNATVQNAKHGKCTSTTIDTAAEMQATQYSLR